MSTSFKNGFEFVVKAKKIADKWSYMQLYRRNGAGCFCPYNNGEVCGTICPHFVIEQCSIADRKCQLVLTCGKYVARYVEIVE